MNPNGQYYGPPPAGPAGYGRGCFFFFLPRNIIFHLLLFVLLFVLLLLLLLELIVRGFFFVDFLKSLGTTRYARVR